MFFFHHIIDAEEAVADDMVPPMAAVTLDDITKGNIYVAFTIDI